MRPAHAFVRMCVLGGGGLRDGVCTCSRISITMHRRNLLAKVDADTTRMHDVFQQSVKVGSPWKCRQHPPPSVGPHTQSTTTNANSCFLSLAPSCDRYWRSASPVPYEPNHTLSITRSCLQTALPGVALNFPAFMWALDIVACECARLLCSARPTPTLFHSLFSVPLTR